jgi:opacity protein-like surface antigen
MGFYGGLGLALAEESYGRFNNGKGVDTGVGFLLNAGYRFHPNLSFEGSCEYLQQLDSKTRDGSILSFNGNFKGYLTTLRFQPYALLGVGITRFELKPRGQSKNGHVGLTARFGGGFDYYLTSRVSLGMTVAYVLTSGNIRNLDHTTIGLGAQYRF